ncbi:uncharacterized protein LOC144155794 [Haemaphysalis longicornis]
MPHPRYMPQTNDTSPTSRWTSPSSAVRPHASRSLCIQVARSAFRRRSPRDGDDKTPIVPAEPDYHRSSSSSPSPERRRARREPDSDIEPSPSYTPKGYLAFVDSSFERDADPRQKTVITPPADLLLPPLGSEGGVASTCDFEPDPTFTGSPPETPAGCLNVTASSGPICRICHEGDQQEALASFCKCSGTVGLLHASCLERWLNAQNVDHCELCRHRFPTQAQFSTARRFFRWLLHSETRVQRAVLGDLFCFVLLTPVAVLSVSMCAHSAAKQALQGRVWESVSLITLAALLLTAYAAWSFLTIRFHYRTFESWQSRNPARRIVAPYAGGTATAEPSSPRELLDVVVGTSDEVRTSSHRQNGDIERPPPSLTPLGDQYPGLRTPFYALGLSSSFVFW